MKATKLAGVLGALLLGAVSTANAGVWSISPDPATIGTASGSVSQSITIAFTGDGSTQDASIDYDFNEALFSAQPTAVGGGSCTTPTIGGTVVLRVLSSSGTNIPSTATTFCTVTFTSLAALTDTGATPEHSFAVRAGSVICGDNTGNPVTPCTASGPIRLDVTTPPATQAPTLTFTPAAGPITLSAGGTGSIGVAAGAGTAGTSTSLVCTPTGAFTSTVTGSPFSPNTSGTVNLGCTPGVAATSGSVSCDPTQSAGTDQAATVFTVNCPAAPVAPSEFSASLSASLFGAPGTTVSGSIGVSNTGTGTLTITCTAPTGGFTVTSGPAATVAPGGSTTIGLSCVTPAAAGATATGTLTCTTNDADEGTVVFALSCSSQVLSVPALGNTAKGMLVALLAGLGLLGFAMRRRIV